MCTIGAAKCEVLVSTKETTSLFAPGISLGKGEADSSILSGSTIFPNNIKHLSKHHPACLLLIRRIKAYKSTRLHVPACNIRAVHANGPVCYAALCWLFIRACINGFMGCRERLPLPLSPSLQSLRRRQTRIARTDLQLDILLTAPSTTQECHQR